MSFIDTSVINQSVIGSTAKTTAATVGAVNTNLQSISKLASTAVSAALAVKNPSLSNINTLVQSAGLSSAVKSLTSALSADVTRLAKGLDSALSSVFKDTTVKTASTVTTAISDPVSSLLNSKVPTSSGFKLTSSEAGSQQISLGGSTSVFGTKAVDMIGTNLSTVMNRYNLDSVSNVAKTITDSNTTNGLKSLFSTVSSVAKTAINVVSTVNKATGGALYDNDTAIFLNKVSNLSSALGGKDLSTYSISSPNTSLLSSTGTTVNTNKSGIDATTANLIASVANLAGCNVPGGYSSYSTVGSSYNLATNLAAQYGMTDLLTSLLSCAMGDTSLGQTSLKNSFITATSSYVSLANLILGSINDPTTLNTSDIKSSILTNQTLSAADKSTVDSIMSQLGTTTIKAYSIDEASSVACPVLNTNTLLSSNSSFVNSVLGDSTITDFKTSQVLTVSSIGTLELAA